MATAVVGEDKPGSRESGYPMACYMIAGGKYFEAVVNSPAERGAFYLKGGSALLAAFGWRSWPIRGRQGTVKHF